ncbi:hypothetical protein GCM10027047_34470 [Rhodococcus aerolatus]
MPSTATRALRTRGRGGALLPVGVLLGAVAVLAARLALAPGILDHVWAEDGAVFLRDAETEGWASLLRTYAGYAHVLPRALAVLGTALPIEIYARYVVVVSLALTALLAAYAAWASRPVLGDARLAAVAGAVVVASPLLGGEVLGNLANLQWVVLPAAAWALAAPRGGWPHVLVALAAALCTPLAVLLAPVALVAHGRRVLRAATVAALLAGLVVQAALVALGRASALTGPERPVAVPPGLPRALLTAASGAAVEGPVAEAVGAAVVLAVLVVGAWQRHEVAARLGLAFGVSAVLVWGVTAVLSAALPSRYALAGAVLSAGALLLVASTLRPLPRLLLPLLLVWGLTTVTTGAEFRASGPDWTTQLDQARAACTAGAGEATAALAPEGWGTATLPCRALSG